MWNIYFTAKVHIGNLLLFLKAKCWLTWLSILLAYREFRPFRQNNTYFRHASNKNHCRFEVPGKRVTLGDGEGIQIPCIPHARFITKLKYILRQFKCKSQRYFSFRLCMCKYRKVEISEHFLTKEPKKFALNSTKHNNFLKQTVRNNESSI